MQLVLDSNGLMVKKRNQSFWIIGKEQKRIISPHRITSIAVMADCLLSSAAIRLAAKHQIPIFFFNAAARVEARLWSPSFGSIATIRRKQVLFALTPEATRWIIELFVLKTQQQEGNLKWLWNRNPSLKESLSGANTGMKQQLKQMEIYADHIPEAARASLMGIEGSIARVYWQALSGPLPEEWQFPARSRRPAVDYFNAALNYLYGMLYSVVGSAILAAGLDPHLGYLHVDQYNKPTMTFDMIEPFRPWVDRLLLGKILSGELKTAFFQKEDAACRISKEGRRYLIAAFNNYMEKITLFGKRKLSRKNHIYRFCGEFAQQLLQNQNKP